MGDEFPSKAANELLIGVCRGRDLLVMDKNLFSKGGNSDPFLEASVGSEVVKTTIKKKTTSPEWFVSL